MSRAGQVGWAVAAAIGLITFIAGATIEGAVVNGVVWGAVIYGVTFTLDHYRERRKELRRLRAGVSRERREAVSQK